MVSNNPFDQLQIWCSRHCTNKNKKILRIETVDNPGWWLEINLTDTELQSKLFEKIEDLSDEYQWFFCKVKDKQFIASGGARDLTRIVEIFINWLEGTIKYFEKNQAFEDLQNWYLAQCNGDWEHIFGITIEAFDNGKWFVKIDLAETDLEDILDLNQNFLLTKKENFFCKIENQQFIAEGTPLSLTAIIENFIHWRNSLYG